MYKAYKITRVSYDRSGEGITTPPIPDPPQERFLADFDTFEEARSWAASYSLNSTKLRSRTQVESIEVRYNGSVVYERTEPVRDF